MDPLVTLRDSLGLKSREVISLVGAGGKTTLMFRLAQELLLSGKRVVTTTTTKIMEPAPGETRALFVDPVEAELIASVRVNLPQYRHVTLATERIGSGKLKGVSPGLMVNLWGLEQVDMIIVEADGAQGRPIKAPREQEPVIPENSTLVVAVLGIDGVEAILDERQVFQPERVSRLTGICLGEKLTPEALAQLILHPEGIIKGAPDSSRVAVFLNKVDLPCGLERAEEVGRRILEGRHPQIERVVLGQLKGEPSVVKVLFGEASHRRFENG